MESFDFNFFSIKIAFNIVKFIDKYTSENIYTS